MIGVVFDRAASQCADVKQELPQATQIDGIWYRVRGPGSVFAWLLFNLVKIAALIAFVWVFKWLGELPFRFV